MIIIKHRVNTLEDLKNVKKENGAEVDVRYHNNEIILHHDPFNHHQNNDLLFEEFLCSWTSNGPLILNVKSEGIENKCIDMMSKFRIRNWFFLDLSMPYFVKFTNIAETKTIKGFTPSNIAVRFSEFEPIEYALSFSGKSEWIWVDCFSYLPLNTKLYKLIKKESFKICLVSPELQNHSKDRIKEFRSQVSLMEIDAVCTKYPHLWN